MFILFRFLIDRPVIAGFLFPSCHIFSLDKDGGYVLITVTRVLPGTVKGCPHFHSAIEPPLKYDFLSHTQPDHGIVHSSGIVQCGNLVRNVNHVDNVDIESGSQCDFLDPQIYTRDSFESHTPD